MGWSGPGIFIGLLPMCLSFWVETVQRARARRTSSKLRAAIHADGIAGDPTRVLRGEERHNRADIIGLADPLERLHAENEGLALVGLNEIRHVGVDHTWCDRVNADAVWPERRRKVLHQCVHCALRGRVG